MLSIINFSKDGYSVYVYGNSANGSSPILFLDKSIILVFLHSFAKFIIATADAFVIEVSKILYIYNIYLHNKIHLNFEID